MSSADGYGLGYKRVDDDPNAVTLVATMDATARWQATSELRSWERDRLHLAKGDRLLDVGCGLGDAALVLAHDLGAAGEVVGIDSSATMLTVARDRWDAVVCPARFSLGDALGLPEPDHSFDAARSERTLQWVPDPSAAVAEMIRVVRPGGRIALIDTDWSTLSLDVGDQSVARMVQQAMRTERGRPSHVGSRLAALVQRAGLVDVVATTATEMWTRWNPDQSPTPDGCFSMKSLADDLVDAGQLDPADTDRFVGVIYDAARHDHFGMSLTMYAVVASKRPY